MSLQVGDFAPDFKLNNQHMEKVSLSDFKGEKNVVVLFFPLVNTSVCEKELCSIGDGLSHYANLNAEILAVSVDSSFAHKLWSDKHNFKFSLLSDFNKEVCQDYGAYYELFGAGKLDYKGVAKRSAFVVDKDGKIQYAEVLENAGEEPNYEAIQEVLKQL